MRLLFSAFTGALLLAFPGCSGDSSTEPDANDGPTASAVIDNTGGTAALEDFTVHIPSGAFDGETTLDLSVDSDDGSFGDEGASSKYLVEGIPREYAEPLRIALPHDGSLTGELRIAAGEATDDPLFDEPQVFYRLYEATDSSGFLVADLPPGAFGSSNKTKSGSGRDPLLDIYFKGVHQWSKPKTTSHFNIEHSAKEKSFVDTHLETSLENAWQKVKDLGFSYEFMFFPMQVYLFSEGASKKSRFAYYHHMEDDPWLFIDAGKVDDPVSYGDSITISASREFFHAVLASRDFKYVGSDGLPDGQRLWFHHAVASYGEKHFVTGTDYEPHGLTPYPENRGLSPFAGMQAGVTGGTWEHGVGMATMIDYLAREYGTSVLPAIYNEFIIGRSPVDALEQAVPDPLNGWWPDYMKSYTLGEHFGYFPTCDEGDYDLGMVYHSTPFYIRSSADTLKRFSETQSDISCMMYYVKLDYPNIDPGATVQFSVSSPTAAADDIAVIVSGFNGLRFQHFGTSTSQVSVSGLRDLMSDASDNIIATVAYSGALSPSYTGSAVIDLEVRVLGGGTPALDFTRCEIDAIVRGEILHSIGTTAYDSRSWRAREKGSFTGNTFFASWRDTSDVNVETVIYQGDMTVIVDPATLIVTSFDLDETAEYSGGTLGDPAPRRIDVHITGDGVQLAASGDGLNGGAVDEDACEAISSFTYQINYTDSGTWNKVIAYDCTEYGAIDIDFDP